MNLFNRSGKQTAIQIGNTAEALASEYLQSQGMELIANNFACKYGEIDLIMREKNTLVFVEVRYRKHTQYGSGAESVDYRKQRKIIRCAEYFLQRNRKYNQYPCRIDVVSIGLGKNNTAENSEPTIDWIPNAIEN